MIPDSKVTLSAIVAAIGLGAGALLGSNGIFVTRTESDCRATLAGAEARIELGQKAMDACSAALDTLTGHKPAAAISGLGAGCAEAAEPAPPECPPCPCLDVQAQQAAEAARQAIQAAQKAP